jgi:hypothetical protein
MLRHAASTHAGATQHTPRHISGGCVRCLLPALPLTRIVSLVSPLPSRRSKVPSQPRHRHRRMDPPCPSALTDRHAVRRARSLLVGLGPGVHQGLAVVQRPPVERSSGDGRGCWSVSVCVKGVPILVVKGYDLSKIGEYARGHVARPRGRRGRRCRGPSGAGPGESRRRLRKQGTRGKGREDLGCAAPTCRA